MWGIDRVMRMDVDGGRRKARLEQRWMDSVNVDLGEKGLSGRGGGVQNFAEWMQLEVDTPFQQLQKCVISF